MVQVGWSGSRVFQIFGLCNAEQWQTHQPTRTVEKLMLMAQQDKDRLDEVEVGQCGSVMGGSIEGQVQVFGQRVGQ